jgi:protein O-GlcNAc transferase
MTHSANTEAQLQLGHQALRAGAVDNAILHFKTAVTGAPDHLPCWVALGDALLSAGQLNGAMEIVSHAVASGLASPGLDALARRTAAALNDLGARHHQAGAIDMALAHYDAAVSLDASLADGHNNRGVALLGLGRGDEAILALGKALELRPGFVEARRTLGQVLLGRGSADEALRHLAEVARDRPDDPGVLCDLGVAFDHLGRATEAQTQFERALELDPYHEVAGRNRLVLLGRAGADVVASARAVTQDHPDSAAAWMGLARSLHVAGDDPACERERLDAIRRAVRLAPNRDVHSDLLTAQLLLPDLSLAEMDAEIEVWRRYHGGVADVAAPFANSPDPERRLRVGLVSRYLGDLPAEPSGLWLSVLPLMRGLDPAVIELHVYALGPLRSDSLRPLAALGVHWHGLAGLDTAAQADVIRRHGVDILICPIGHTFGDNMSLFGVHPAPVQINHLGMFSSGVSAMGYATTDPFLRPPGCAEAYDETLLPIANVFCFEPLHFAPEVTPPPALVRGGVTFGCFNLYRKLNAKVAETFAAILHRVPGSRLCLKSRDDGYRPGTARDRILTAFAGLGIAAGRVDVLDTSASAAEHLACFAGVDIMLDTFPYGGCLTTYDALWMGVPVVAMRGDRYIYRISEAVLGAAGFTGLVCEDAESYVERAVGLASDLPALAELRRTMRARVAASPLCDHHAHGREFERVLRRAWRDWCESVR